MRSTRGGGNRSVNFTSQPDEFVKQKDKGDEKECLSTGAKAAIIAGVGTIFAVGVDVIACKGKHIKQLFGKGRNNLTPNNINNSGSARFRIVNASNPHNVHHYNLYNRTHEELAQECIRFKSETGAMLHVPDTMAASMFGFSCSTLELAARNGNFPKDIKHVLVGHGYGSSVRGDWSIIGRGGNVFNYINNNPQIKPGEMVLVLCCESGEKVLGRRAVGDKVILSLTDGTHPAKIVVKGENKIAGELYFPKLALEDNTVPFMYIYPDKPAFRINRRNS